jgi:hypothetical protein
VQPADVTGMRIDAEIVVTAPPGVVWDLLANITNTGNWSPECIRTAWLDGHHDARPGVRFSVHGPGDSGLRWMMRRHPERSSAIIEDRRQRLQANMRHTLAAMKAAAEEQPC